MKFKKLNYLIHGILILLVFTSTALAAEFKVPQDGENITIGQNEKLRNLYTAGNIVSIDANVEGDLVAAGNIITVIGNTEDDLIIAGGTVIVKGDVGGNLRVAGGNVIIEGKIGEDLIILGGNISLTKTALIGGDVITLGGSVDIECTVNGNIYIQGGRATINSKIGKNVKANVDHLNIGENALIEGDIDYTSPKEANIKEAAEIKGKINYTESKKFPTREILTFALAIRILSSILAGLFLIYLFRKPVRLTITEGLTHLWSNLGIGILAFLLTPLFIIILLVTLIGIRIAMLVAIFFTLLIILSLTLGSISIGSWLLKTITGKEEYPADWKAVIIGILAVNILILIPLVGWLIAFAFALVSLGSMYRLIYYKSVRR